MAGSSQKAGADMPAMRPLPWSDPLAVAQVTGRAGERQARGANRSLATISNGLSKSTAFVFSRDA